MEGPWHRRIPGALAGVIPLCGSFCASLSVRRQHAVYFAILSGEVRKILKTAHEGAFTDAVLIALDQVIGTFAAIMIDIIDNGLSSGFLEALAEIGFAQIDQGTQILYCDFFLEMFVNILDGLPYLLEILTGAFGDGILRIGRSAQQRD